jgi:RNA polymerase subunit RPABC4/transcription elongation factor Spt4
MLLLRLSLKRNFAYPRRKRRDRWRSYLDGGRRRCHLHFPGVSHMFMFAWSKDSLVDVAWAAGLIIASYWLVLWMAVTYWAARDIHARTGNWLFQFTAVLLVAVGSVPGLGIYYLVRPSSTRRQRFFLTLAEQVLQKDLEELQCNACGRVVQDHYLICPACLAQLKRACAGCSKALENSWEICPYCLTERRPAAAMIGEQFPEPVAEPASTPDRAAPLAPPAPALPLAVSTAPEGLAS